MLSAQTPVLCVDSQLQLLVMPFPFPCATGRDELLITAKALLVQALKVTECLLDGFPIPATKGTITAILHIITEAEVRAVVELSAILVSLSPSQRTAANAELCDELREHILKLHKQLIQPLVGKTEDDIPRDMQLALEDFTGYVASFPLGMGF